MTAKQVKSLLPPHPPAILALADGSIFSGISVGAGTESAPVLTTGEVVFNTAITGYQEILTDPSYAEQLITFTYPHIGNIGVNVEDQEASKIFAKGIIIRELSTISSNWRATNTLSDFLKQHAIPGISQIDTRCLTKILREKGSQNACLMTGQIDREQALRLAKEYLGITGKDLTDVVSTNEVVEWPNLTDQILSTEKQNRPHIVVYDFGVKLNILQCLIKRGCRLTLVPAKTNYETVLSLKPDGILLSNGPGDPAACQSIILNIKQLIQHASVPIFGICLGFQLLALALGAKTFKMKTGHHGGNHPVQDIATKQVYITSQNHGFAVDEHTMPAELYMTHRSLFDNTLQGFMHRTKSIFGFQGHPEASPGPQDINHLFKYFVDNCLNKA